MTLYTVLRMDDEGWHVFKDTIEARSSESAIRQAIDGEVKEGMFVAIPSRSWEPKSVRVETRITLS